LRGPRLRVGAAALLAACAASTALDARDWTTAGHESRRILAELKRLSPPDEQVVVLSLPTDYRAAHLFPDSLDVALHDSGRPATTVTTCAPVHAVALEPGQVSFHPAPDGSWIGDSTRDSPFDVPVLGGTPSAVSAGCVIGKARGTTSFYLGTVRSMAVLPRFIGTGRHVFVYFDGRDMRRAGG
ncbi:MAG TPA: hypothetical protein VKU35_00270, partial [Candidatus Limnocylindria bacterium]|nr:hypothetical protein [Candidatus Limnocylindria bacterium]